MSESLPEGWIETTFPVVSLLNPKSELDDSLEVGFSPMALVPVNFSDKLKFEMRTWGAVKKGFTHFKNDDVIFAKITPCFENSKAAIVSGLPNSHGAGSTEYYVLRPIIMPAAIIFYWVKTTGFLKNAESKMTGSVGQKRVPKTFVQNYPLPLPPLNEQKRIVAKLDAVIPRIDSLKARLDKIPALIKRFRQSVLTAAVTGKLTETWREEHNLSNKWVTTTLEEQSEYITSGSRGWAKYYSKFGAMFIRAQNINTDNLILDDVAFVSLPYKTEGLRTRIIKHDILITITGANVTKTALVKTDISEAYVNQHVALVRLKKIIFSEYIYLWLVSPTVGRAQLEEAAYGAGKPGLNLQNIKDVDISLPPLEEQKEIVRQVDNLFALADKLETHYQNAKARIDKLSQSVLAKAFRGELTPQDPNDEPAGKLLKRIMAAKAKMEEALKDAKKKGASRKAKARSRK
jgi:type I restriction enzyme S subunit